MSKKIVKKIRESLKYLQKEKISAPIEIKNAIDFLLEATFFDKDDDYFQRIVKADGYNEEKYKFFNGMRFTRQEDGHYRGYHGKYLHRAVWEHYNGSIPKGYVTHHKDFNPSNNDIKNLEILTKSEHRKLHSDLLEPEKYICDYCGKEFERKFKGGRKHHFCSHQCSYHWSYENNNEIRICKECGKEFSTYKYNDRKYCSKECWEKVNARAHRKNNSKFAKNWLNPMKIIC